MVFSDALLEKFSVSSDRGILLNPHLNSSHETKNLKHVVPHDLKLEIES